MASNNHKSNCANAQNPGCVCSGCGGALHGWKGWTALAAGPQKTRDDRRRRIEAKIERNNRTGMLNGNARNRQAFVDLARLDLTDYLSTTESAHRTVAPDPATASSDLDRLTTLANSIMAETWDEISREIDNHVKNERTARDVKKQLADHAWCTLLVSLIRRIEQFNEAAQALSDRGREFIQRAMTEHLSGIPQALAGAVAGILVGTVWSALARLSVAHFPLVGADTLRVLRMLALFTCPSVEHHPEVYRYAARPLLGDGLGLVSDGIRSQVTMLFTAWWQRRDPEANA